MATFTLRKGTFDDYTYTEPCMNCFASVTYQAKEAVPDPRLTGRKCIICPNCGKLMSVTFSNSCLC